MTRYALRRRGHLEILDALEKDEAKVPGLYLGGNYRTGVAFGDCVGFGLTEAAKIAGFLKKEGVKGEKLAA